MVMTLVNFTICVLAVLFLWYTNRSVAGLKSILWGFLSISAGFALAYLCKPVLGRAATWFGNTAMTGGLLFLLDGALCFRNFRRMPAWLLTTVCGPFLIAQTYLLYIRDDRPLRVAVLSILMACIAFAGAGVMCLKVRREDRVTFGIVAFGFATYGTSQVLRFCTSLSAVPNPDPQIGLFVMNIAMVGALFGLSTATNFKLNERIEKLALMDPLTGLPNRRAFDDRLDCVHTKSIATGSPVALYYIDIDRFKAVNDLFGHHIGDMVLKEVAVRLSNAVHENDCVVRLGGDEFVVLSERFPTRASAEPLLQQLCRCLSEPLAIGGVKLDLSVSCGLAFYPEEGNHPSELLREADAEMYLMKRRFTSVT